MQKGVDISIGKPVANNKALILDDKLNPVSTAEMGELCISGPQVARGYLNREKLTAEKFFQHPVFGRIYRTGDLVKQIPTGDLTYHGRIDTQVKIGGYRIELSSIETHLASEHGVLEAVCVVQEHGTIKKLVAFITTTNLASVNEGSIKNNLAKVLPPYMVPSEIRVVDSFPRMVSLKIDRKALGEMRGQKNIMTKVASTSNPLTLRNALGGDVEDLASVFIESEEKVSS